MLLKDNLAQIDLSIFSQIITTALEIYNFKKKIQFVNLMDLYNKNSKIKI